jgi:hypothetical protein
LMDCEDEYKYPPSGEFFRSVSFDANSERYFVRLIRGMLS